LHLSQPRFRPSAQEGGWRTWKTYFLQCRSTENTTSSISVHILNCSSVSPRLRASACETSAHGHVMKVDRDPKRYVPPAFPFPLPLSAVQVGQITGNLCSSIRELTCFRRHSRQKVCPQESMRAIESTGISSIHILHSNRRWAELARWVRCTERA
jgi:hypothetical protein